MIVEQYEKRLCGYAYSLAGNIDLARDAVQDTFLRLCREPRGKLAGREAAWLFRVCRTRVFDIKKKEWRLSPLSEAHEASLRTEDASPSEILMDEEQESLLARMLAALPERQREVICLKFQHDLSYRDIAQVLDISEGNVGYILHTGVKTLRENCAAWEVHDHENHI
jgi:RNA polymerase sigma-70 factor (ECF subfamily)